MKSIKVSFKVRSRTEYWESKVDNPALPLLDKPCEGCAITTGFYIPHAEEMIEIGLGEEKENRILEGWFCHNHCGKACRGAYNYVHMKRKRAEESK